MCGVRAPGPRRPAMSGSSGPGGPCVRPLCGASGPRRGRAVQQVGHASGPGLLPARPALVVRGRVRRPGIPEGVGQPLPYVMRAPPAGVRPARRAAAAASALAGPGACGGRLPLGHLRAPPWSSQAARRASRARPRHGAPCPPGSRRARERRHRPGWSPPGSSAGRRAPAAAASRPPGCPRVHRHVMRASDVALGGSACRAVTRRPRDVGRVRAL